MVLTVLHIYELLVSYIIQINIDCCNYSMIETPNIPTLPIGTFDHQVQPRFDMRTYVLENTSYRKEKKKNVTYYCQVNSLFMSSIIEVSNESFHATDTLKLYLIRNLVKKKKLINSSYLEQESQVSFYVQTPEGEWNFFY